MPECFFNPFIKNNRPSGQFNEIPPDVEYSLNTNYDRIEKGFDRKYRRYENGSEIICNSAFFQ